MHWSSGAGLEGKGVMVTGGVGHAAVLAFAGVGARVCAVDLDLSRVEEVVGETADPARHLAVGYDLTDFDGLDKLVLMTQTVLGRLDVLVHLAAVIVRKPLGEVTEADWDLQSSVNLKSTFFLNRAAAFLMREQGEGGRIINCTSQAWWTGGLSGSIAYAATKAGIVALTRGFARTFATDGITVNVVAPGGVDTPMMHTASEQAVAEFVSQTPVGRLALPEEIAETIVFLASERAGYITGATINITGGQLLY